MFMRQRGQKITELATIYHYQLVRRIPIHRELIASYLSIALIFGLFQGLMYGTAGILAWMLGILAVYIIHFIIIRLTLIRVDEPDDRRWSWRIRAPWIGYVPVQMVEHGLLRRLHRHLLWFGLCVIAVIYPWVNEATMISLICWHFWTLAPRIVILRKVRKDRRDGVLKFEPTDVSFYHR